MIDPALREKVVIFALTMPVRQKLLSRRKGLRGEFCRL